MNGEYQLTQVNIACMKEVGIDNPIMKGFSDYRDEINFLAEKARVLFGG